MKKLVKRKIFLGDRISVLEKYPKVWVDSHLEVPVKELYWFHDAPSTLKNENE